MEFWGVEVKSGQPLSVEVGENKVLHLSQASLGEVKKGKNESACLSVEVDGKKLVLGTLISGTLPQQLFDLVFDRDFVLSHNWKNGSIYYYGYIADQPYDDPENEFDDEFDSEDEAIPLQAAENGKLGSQPKQEKVPVAEKANASKNSIAGKQKVKIVEPSKEDDDSDDDSDDAISEDDSDSEGDSLDGEDDSDDDEDSDEDEETPQKVQSSKKRPTESATKTPVPDKKAKLVTPQKTDGKKGGVHVATPHPSKQTGKTPANKSTPAPANKSNQKSPKTGEHSCTSCKKNFNSEVALSSHNRAKHSAA